MKSISREFQIFVKPVGSKCNLNCHYCYYLEKEGFNPNQNVLLMSDDILERYIIQHLEAATEPVVLFSWHGGEPGLAGIEFYRKAVSFQKKHKLPGKKILNGMQTNGTLLHEEWCSFLAEENFMVGISMDGPEKMHDQFRRTKTQDPTFKSVLHGLKLLQKYQISTEVLCVVNAINVKHPLEVYHYFREMGVGLLSFLPLVERLEKTGSGVSKASVPVVAFGKFLSLIFDEWKEKDIGLIKIQIFEEALRTAFKQDHSLCIFKKTCGGVPVIEKNGDFYSCDHYVDPKHKLGNITRDSLVNLLEHPQQKAFGQAKQKSLPQYCRECEVLDMCNGGCPKNRFIHTASGEEGLNYLCEGYKMFFTHCQPFIRAVADQWN